MKKSSIIIHSIFFLIIFTGSSVSYAGEIPGIIEMADGNYITFPTTPEEKAFHEGTRVKSEWFKPAKYAMPGERVLEFEMAESGIKISFPLSEKETAAAGLKNSGSELPHSVVFIQPEQRVIKIELPETGHYILFPVSQ